MVAMASSTRPCPASTFARRGAAGQHRQVDAYAGPADAAELVERACDEAEVCRSEKPRHDDDDGDRVTVRELTGRRRCADG